MKLTDFETLELAQAYEVVTDTKQVGSGQARGFFVNEECIGDYAGMKLWTLFNIAAKDVTNPLFPLASAIVITASDAQSYFGMDVTKSDGIANRAGLAGLVAMGIMSQETADKFISKTLSVTNPFIEVSQEQFDQAKADLLIYGEVAPLAVGYPRLGGDIDYAVVIANKSVQFAVVLLAPALADTKIEVFVHTDYSDTENFESVGVYVGYILIKNGETNGSLKITKSLSTKIQASAKSNVIGDYNLFVKAL